MTTTVLTLPRAFAVRFKDAHVWSVRSFARVEWNWPEENIKPLSKALHRRIEEVDRKQHSIDNLQLITLHFDGTIEPRDRGSQKDFKGRLFFAYAGDVVYSKIDVRNGAIGIIPPQMPRVAVSSEYPVYVVAPDVALPSYIQLLFRTSYFRRAINSMISGASGRKRVQPEQIEDIRVPLPPPPIQHAILKRWDQAQTEIAKARLRTDRLENEIPLLVYAELGVSPPALNSPTAKYLVQRWKDVERWSFDHLSRARHGLLGFSHSKFPIIPLSQCLRDTMNGYCIKPVTGPTPYKMLKLSALTPAGLDVTESKFVNVPKLVAEKFSLHKGDLLICRSVGSYEYIAKSALVENDEPSILFPDIIIRARFNSSILPEYVREVIQTPLGRSYFQSSARTAVGMWKIGAEDIRNFPVPLPPLDEQRNIVHQVQGLRIEIAREQEKARSLAAEVQQEVEEMILGTRPVPEFNGLQKGTV
jgi:type I restriction enzyme S subunit